MGTERLVLQGRHIRLEPLDHGHVDGLGAAGAVDPSLYQWSPVPQGKVEAQNTSKPLWPGATPEPQCLSRLCDWMTVS